MNPKNRSDLAFPIQIKYVKFIKYKLIVQYYYDHISHILHVSHLHCISSQLTSHALLFYQILQYDIIKYVISGTDRPCTGYSCSPLTYGLFLF